MENGLINQNLSHLNVLLVDDQAESRDLLRAMLGELGITNIHEVPDGKAALACLESGPDSIQVILCDWNMPVMSGIQFLREVRNTGPDVAFMMITGRSDQNSVIEAKKNGVDGYIRKPYSTVQLEAKLRVMLQRMKAA